VSDDNVHFWHLVDIRCLVAYLSNPIRNQQTAVIPLNAFNKICFASLVVCCLLNHRSQAIDVPDQ